MNETSMDPSRQVIISRTLVLVTKHVLTKVIQDSERAVLEITEKLQGMTSLTEAQKNKVSQALESFYDTDESRGLATTLNDAATAMLEAAQAGDLAKVESIAAAPEYQQARTASKKLHDTLQHLTTSDEVLSDYIMPVLVGLQFQDNLRQELESIVKCFDEYFSRFDKTLTVSVTDTDYADFWKKAATNFTNMEARKVVLTTAFGEDVRINDKDVRSRK